MRLLNISSGVTGNNGSYMALCPVHNDHRPSLSITAKDGVTLIHCFAGCDAVDVLKAVGLTFDDLWDEHNMSFESFGRHYG